MKWNAAERRNPMCEDGLQPSWYRSRGQGKDGKRHEDRQCETCNRMLQ